MRSWRILVWVMMVGAVVFGGCASERKMGDYLNMRSHEERPAEANEAAVGWEGLRGFEPMAGEELWVIGKPAENSEVGMAAAVRVAPGLWGFDAAGGKVRGMTLLHTEVAAEITGCVASVNVTQRFVNEGSAVVDGIYTIPLPAGAGVDDFVLTIGGRHIRGIIRERAEAERIYEAARRQGFAASLVMEDGENSFSQRITNIGAGAKVEVGVRYFHALGFKDGEFEWRFPVGAVCATGDLELGATIEGAAEDVESENHQVLVKAEGAGRTLVKLDGRDAGVRKDFVLRWKETRELGGAGRPGVFVKRDADGKGGTFMLMWVPPAKVEAPRRGVEVVFVVDGRMGAEWEAVAKRVVDAGIAKLGSGDGYRVVRFESAEGLAAGMKGLDFPHEAGRSRVLVFVGDGSFGDKGAVVRALGKEMDSSRVLAMGIGAGADRGFLDLLAVMGHGNSGYVGKGDLVEGVVGDWFEKVLHPVVTDVVLDWGGVKVSEVCPGRVMELVTGRPVVVTGRFVGELGDLTVTENVAGKEMKFVIPLSRALTDNAGVAGVWARMRMAELWRGAMVGGGDVSGELKRIALEGNLVSGFTAFLVVDAGGR